MTHQVWRQKVVAYVRFSKYAPQPVVPVKMCLYTPEFHSEDTPGCGLRELWTHAMYQRMISPDGAGGHPNVDVNLSLSIRL